MSCQYRNRCSKSQALWRQPHADQIYTQGPFYRDVAHREVVLKEPCRTRGGRYFRLNVDNGMMVSIKNIDQTLTAKLARWPSCHLGPRDQQTQRPHDFSYDSPPNVYRYAILQMAGKDIEDSEEGEKIIALDMGRFGRFVLCCVFLYL